MTKDSSRILSNFIVSFYLFHDTYVILYSDIFYCKILENVRCVNLLSDAIIVITLHILFLLPSIVKCYVTYSSDHSFTVLHLQESTRQTYCLIHFFDFYARLYICIYRTTKIKDARRTGADVSLPRFNLSILTIHESKERHEMGASVSGIHRFQSRKEKRENRRKCLPPNGWRVGERKKRTRRGILPRMNIFRMADTNMAVGAHHRGL